MKCNSMLWLPASLTISSIIASPALLQTVIFDKSMVIPVSLLALELVLAGADFLYDLKKAETCCIKPGTVEKSTVPEMRYFC